MMRARGGLEDECRSATVVWAVWYTGSYAAANEVFARVAKPDRVIVLNPDGLCARPVATTFGRSLDQLTQDIRTTTDRAIKAGVPIRLFDGAMTLMVIGEPESGNGWVRVELAIPFSSVRPQVIIRQRQSPELFHEFVKAFRTMWEHPETIAFVGQDLGLPQRTIYIHPNDS